MPGGSPDRDYSAFLNLYRFLDNLSVRAERIFLYLQKLTNLNVHEMLC